MAASSLRLVAAAAAAASSSSRRRAAASIVVAPRPAAAIAMRRVMLMRGEGADPRRCIASHHRSSGDATRRFFGSVVVAAGGDGPSSDRDRGGVHGGRFDAAAARRCGDVRAFSSSSAASSSPEFSSSSSFRRTIRPFLRACHPDAVSAMTGGIDGDDGDRPGADGKVTPRLSRRAKAVNLKAVQTVNGLVDALEDLVGRCTPPIYRGDNIGDSMLGAGSLPELDARYEIEFILPTTDETDGRVRRKQNRNKKMALTLRSVTVSFPERLREDVRHWALTPFPERRSRSPSEYDDGPSRSEEEAVGVATELREHARSEFLRLLTIAGMQAPAPSPGEGDRQRTRAYRGEKRKEEGRWTMSDHFLHELGVDPTEEEAAGPRSAFYGRTQMRPSSPLPRREAGKKAAPPAYRGLEKERAKFMNSVPWDRFADDYDNAFSDAQADWITERLDLYDVKTLEGRERREQFVSRICGAVRIPRAMIDGDVEGADEIPEGLDVVAQLIAIRRLSLILNDNFDHLKMERMGRMWERLVIVLTPPRNLQKERRVPTREDGTPIIHRNRKLTKWERRKRLRERLAPKSRGSMRQIAQTLLGPKESEDAEADESADDGKEELSLDPTESGFKFSYGTQSDQGAGHVTAYVPIDFRDGELVRQLYTHLYDYFDTCCGNMGFLRYGADGKVSANVVDGARSSRSANKESGGASREKKMGAEE